MDASSTGGGKEEAYSCGRKQTTFQLVPHQAVSCPQPQIHTTSLTSYKILVTVLYFRAQMLDFSFPFLGNVGTIYFPVKTK